MSNGFDVAGLVGTLLKDRWFRTVTGLVMLVFLVTWGWPKFIEPAFQDEGEVEIPKSELMQLKEIRHHMMEDPLWKKELVADNGKPGLTFYYEDMCQITAWEHLYLTTEGERVEGEVIKVVFHPSRLFEPEVMVAGIFKEEATGCGDPEECVCLDPWEHPGESVQTEVRDAENKCVIWFWNEWPEGCKSYQRYDDCEDGWIDEEPQWKCCSCDHGGRGK